jgi:hypothetical protein
MRRLRPAAWVLAAVSACAPSGPASDVQARDDTDRADADGSDAMPDDYGVDDVGEDGPDEIADRVDGLAYRPDVACNLDPEVPVWSGCAEDAAGGETFQAYRPPSAVTVGDPADCGPGCRQLSPTTTRGLLYDVWADTAVFVLGSPASDLYYALLATGETYQVPLEYPERGETFGGVPTISDGVITYEAADAAVGGVQRERLCTYDTRSWTRTILTEWDRPVPTGPSDDDPVVWLLDGYLDQVVGVWGAVPGSNVFLLDQCDPEMRPVGPFNCCVGGWQGPPQLWDRTFVIDGDPTGRLEVFVYDDRTGLTASLSHGTADQADSAIHGRLIVWTDARNGNGQIWGWPDNLDIYGMNLDDGVEFPVTLHPANQQFPDVYGCRVVWEDTRDDPIDPYSIRSDSNVNVYMLDMATGDETRLTDWPDWDSQPRVWGSRAFVVGYPVVGRGDALFVIDLDARK